MSAKNTRVLRSNLESLESKRMMTVDYLVLDFTPDAIPGANERPDSFVSTFVDFQDAFGGATRFLDFDGNNRIDNNDVYQGALKITDRVSELFQGTVQVIPSDLWNDTNFGQRALNWGTQSPSLVDVVYVGGWSPFEDALGMAEFQAPQNMNLEYFAHTYSSDIANGLTAWATPTDFAFSVAKTVAHEVGHLLGLGHEINHPVGSNNIMNYSSGLYAASFQNSWSYNVELTDMNGQRYVGAQNPWFELVNSYNYQPHATPSALGLTYQGGFQHGHSDPKAGHEDGLATWIHVGDEAKQHLLGIETDGVRGMESWIIGGAETQSEWPWMVSLRYGGQHGCGGALIGPDIVVTAAHCVDFVSPAQIEVVLGLHDRDGDGDIHEVKSIEVHPEWNRATFSSDIAILMLETPSERETISLLSEEDERLDDPGNHATVIGWGWTNPTSDPADVLKQIGLEIVEAEVANDAFGPIDPVTDSMLTALTPESTPCRGDSGGPLMVQDSNGSYLLAGIVSFGLPGCPVGQPGVFTRVTSFTDWINGKPSIKLNDGTLDVVGTWNDDHIEVRTSTTDPSMIEVLSHVNGQWSVSRFSYHDVDGLRINSGSGDDYVRVGELGHDLLVEIFGGKGNDTIIGGADVDYIFGQEGDDRLYGRGGADFLVGGEGNDRLFGGSGDDRLYGNDGHDQMWGGLGNDTLYGWTGNDTLLGNQGDDWLYGFDGNDSIYGGDGDDELRGGGGDDYLVGNTGHDELFGGDGLDTLFGNEGNDSLNGENGDDRLIGGVGQDRLLGEAGNDRLWGSAGDDTLIGGAGDDMLAGNEGSDRLYGQQGRDQLYGGESPDWLYGGSEDDELYGGDGNDFLDGEAGRDVTDGGAGDDLIQDIRYAQVGFRRITILDTDDGGIFSGGSHDEIYFQVSGNRDGSPFSYSRNPPRTSYGRGDVMTNLALWDGNLAEGESISMTIRIRESDTFGDPTIGVFHVTVRNVDGEILTDWRAGENVNIGVLAIGSGPDGGSQERSHLATGGDATYEVVTGAFDRAVVR